MATAIRKRRTSALLKLTPAGKLLEMIAMRHVPQALHVVAVLGIADLLADGPKSSDELAQVTGSHNEQVSDYGFDIGGPILKDKAWFYASYSLQPFLISTCFNAGGKRSEHAVPIGPF